MTIPRRHLGRGASAGPAGFPRPLYQGGSDGAACPAPASRGSWHRARHMPLVIDADLQHDEDAAIQDAGVAARWRSRPRGRQPLYRGRQLPRVLTGQRPASAHLPPKSPTACCGVKIADPMSGFFMIRRDRFRTIGAATLHARLQDPARYRRHRARRAAHQGNSPYTFGSRLHGESKLDSTVARDFLGSCWRSSPATWCRCAFSCLRWSGRPACSCISPRCSLRSRIFGLPFPEAHGLRARWSP